MSKKWYEMFVSVERSPESAEPPSETGQKSAAESIAEIAATVAPEPKFTRPVTNPTSFDQIYQAAEIATPAHGYSIFKISDMLQSEHIRSLPSEVKRSSILVALDAAGVKIQEVIEDAVRRDRALDTFERVQQKALDDLEARKSDENKQIQAEIDKLVAERRAKMQANTDEVARQKEAFFGWRLQKQQEEQKIADTVTYFVGPNPITTGGAAPAPDPKKPAGA